MQDPNWLEHNGRQGRFLQGRFDNKGPDHEGRGVTENTGEGEGGGESQT